MFKAKRIFLKNDAKEKENIRKFESIHNRYAGKRIFIIGNGPSLNKMPLYLLKDEYTMCFNRFNLMGERLNWKPNFFAVTDDLVIKDMASSLNEEVTPKVDYAFFPDLHPSNINVKKYIHDRENVLWLHVDKPNFSDHLPDCGINKTVVNAGIQIAVWMGFSEIYLLGVDMAFVEQKVKKSNARNWVAMGEDPNHFDPRYFDKGKKYHNPGVEEMMQEFEKCRQFFEPRGVNIYNAGVGGKLEVFERKRFDTLLSISDSEKEHLFMESIHSTNPNIKLSEFQLYSEINRCANFFLPSADGEKLIKEKIISHIPYGPYQGYYYFLKRQSDIVDNIELRTG